MTSSLVVCDIVGSTLRAERQFRGLLMPRLADHEQLLGAVGSRYNARVPIALRRFFAHHNIDGAVLVEARRTPELVGPRRRSALGGLGWGGGGADGQMRPAVSFLASPKLKQARNHAS